MSDYQVLARKWRPKSFEDMVGQEHILRMLSNALRQKRLHHAYLFTGTRGVGKTSSARIFAKCLNCEVDVTPTPCNECANCKAIDAGQFLDLYEIDAASRTKVEDTRDILDNVLYQPSQGRYKIYIIDEVHMLSNHSFNALLKTLEEPPSYVKFILATTDPKKLPVTILSRCLQFHLRHITPEEIAKRLAHICDIEKISHDKTSLNMLAKAANGSMRDALSLLDQANAYAESHLTAEHMHAMLGCVMQNDVEPLLSALSNKDTNLAFTHIRKLAEQTPDFQQLLETLIETFHHIALSQFSPEALTLDESLKPFLSAFTPEDVQLYYQIALLGRRDLALSPSPQQGFEMTFLRMLAFQPDNASRGAPAPSTERKEPKVKIDDVAPGEPKISEPATQPKKTPSPTAVEWRDILPKLELSGMAYALASNCSLEKVQDHQITLLLGSKHEPMLNPKLKERFNDALNRYFNKPMELIFKSTAQDIKTPAKEAENQQQATLNTAKEKAVHNPSIKQLMDLYDATVDVTLV